MAQLLIVLNVKVNYYLFKEFVNVQIVANGSIILILLVLIVMLLLIFASNVIQQLSAYNARMV